MPIIDYYLYLPLHSYLVVQNFVNCSNKYCETNLFCFSQKAKINTSWVPPLVFKTPPIKFEMVVKIPECQISARTAHYVSLSFTCLGN